MLYTLEWIFLNETNLFKHVDVNQFNHDLLRWFYENKRDLPWRKTQNPYYIWISEIMLQQTQVDTVIPYYERFIKTFPTMEDLAYADEETVLKNWEGLGYYSRARNLQQGVREVVEEYDAKIPETRKEILSLKGVGPYTSGAILSIAYNVPEPAVDGNVMRVLSRVFMIDDDITKVKTKKHFEDIVYRLIPHTDPSGFNQSLMELGALVCKPRQPECLTCPLQKHCLAYDEGVQHEFPVKKKKTKPKPMSYIVLIIYNSKKQILIEKRPENGLLANLWQFPMIQIEDDSQITHGEQIITKNIKGVTDIENTKKQFFHQFSHLKWSLNLFRANLLVKETWERGKWVDRGDLELYPFPVSHQKIIQTLI